MDLSHDDTIAAMATRVLQEAPPRFNLTALSMGGYVAFEILRREPSRVLKLALFDTSARPDSLESTEKRNSLIKLAQSGKFKGVTPRLLPTLVHPDRVHDQSVAEPVLKMAERLGREAFVRQQKAIMGRADSRPALPHIKIPALVVAGRQDTLTPPEVVEEIAKGITGSKFVLIEDCGHLPPLERPQATTALLREWFTN
jgi:pimeloyl-ACP methyl ester carboxylesterase